MAERLVGEQRQGRLGEAKDVTGKGIFTCVFSLVLKGMYPWIYGRS